METVLTIIGFTVALIFAAISLWLAMRNAAASSEIKNFQTLRQELDATKLLLREAKDNTTTLEADLQSERSVLSIRLGQLEDMKVRLQKAEKQSFTLNAELKGERATHEATKAAIEKSQADLSESFQLLAGKALEKNNGSFLELANQNFQTHFEKHKVEADKDLEKRTKGFETFFKPAEQTLENLKNHVTELEKKREDAYEKVEKATIEIAVSNKEVYKQLESSRQATARLDQALRNPRTRGRWGEIQLRNTLELAGMSNHVDFYEQFTITETEDDGTKTTKRPDAIVRLPGPNEGALAIDAKTPLEAYLEAVEEADEDKRDFHIQRHSDQLLVHANNLSSKKYWSSLEKSPKFVIMFIPGEHFLAAAVENNPNLIEAAMKKNVVICTPASLMALVRTVAYGWQQHDMSENAGKILEEATEFHKRMKTYMEHIAAVGKSLDSATKAYNKSVGSFDDRLLPSMRRIESLGVTENSPLEMPKNIDTQVRLANNSISPSIETTDEVK